MNFRPEVSQLIRESGMEKSKCTRSSLAGRNRYLSLNNELVKMPSSAAAMMLAKVWSLQSRLRMLAEPFIPRHIDHNESVSDFIRRRLGNEMLEKAIEPFVAGTLAADPDLACARSTLPRLTALERKYGSLTMGVLWHKVIRRRTAHVTESFSFDGGMSDLVRGLAAHPLIRVRRGMQARSVARDRGQWRIEGDARTRHVEQLVLATPGNIASTLLQQTDRDIAEGIGQIRYVPMSVVHFGFHRDDVPHALDGSGFLTSRGEHCRINGNLWMSSLFPGRAPAGHVLLSSYVGGSRHPESIHMSDTRLADLALQDLKQRLGIRKMPCWQHIHRHNRALPVYHGQHYSRVQGIRQRLEQHPGLHLCGNYLDGVSVRDRILAGRQLGTAIGKLVPAIPECTAKTKHSSLWQGVAG